MRDLFGTKKRIDFLQELKNLFLPGSMTYGMSPRHCNAINELSRLFASRKERTDDFVSRLIYYINLKGKTNVEVYTGALMTPDCFSKIISKKTKQPKKENVIALAFGLGLNLEEAEDLLSYAGYFLSDQNHSDIVCKYFFDNQPCDIFDVNEALERFGFLCLGLK